MDMERFDGWVRTFTTARSRRGALLGLLGGAVGLFGLTDIEAKHKEKRRKKRR